MNRKSFLRFCLLLLILSPLGVLAQPRLRISNIYSIPGDTVYYPNTVFITYKMVVENVGNNQLSSPCNIDFRYDGSVGDSVKLTWSLTNFEVGQTDTVQFNDPLGTLNIGRYKGGGNIIVIWPQADNPNVQAPDTTYFPIFIDASNGVLDQAAFAKRVVVYPNPVQDRLSFRYLQSQKVEYVRILTMDGKLAWESESAVQHVDMSGLGSGFYLVVVKFKDGLMGTMRISKP